LLKLVSGFPKPAYKISKTSSGYSANNRRSSLYTIVSQNLKMKKILPLLLLTFIFSCSSKPAETALTEENIQLNSETEKLTEEKEKTAVHYSIEKATKADFDKAKKASSNALTLDTLNSRKKNGVIEVLTNGKWKPLTAFKDTLNSPESDDDEIREYKYVGQIKSINKYIVEGYFWEHYECYLVDKATGKIDTTWTRPYLSPDKKMLSSLSMPYGLEGPPLGIQIFRIEDNGLNLSKFIEINQQEWSPYDFYWESPRSVIIQILPVDRVLEINGIPKEEDYSYIRLKI
jgi:cell division protein FtsL